MDIVRVEPTPSPNTMKVVLNFKRQDNKSATYTSINSEQPQYINDLLAIEDVKSIFHVMDFLAIDKAPRANWEDILPKITATLNNEDQDIPTEPTPDSHYGEIKAEVLTFKGIPYQIKLTSNNEEKRKQLPEIYVDSMLAAQQDHDNVVFMRKWEDLGVRYGDIEDVMSDIMEEVTAIYPVEQLDDMIKEALATSVTVPEPVYNRVTVAEYQQANDWKERLRMLNHFPTPTFNDLPVLELALQEQKVPLRRQAIVLLGMIENEAVLPYIYQGLHDKSPAVRRTAGDCISDLGYQQALPEMEKLLDDPQKIVRWRAAMFIFDEGNEQQLTTLKAHVDDSAYEVKLQIEMAISRIENGDEALGSVWKQIANRNK